MPTALEGVDVVVMISGSDAADRIEHPRSFIEGARQAGIAHVVYTPFLGATPDAVFTLAGDHWATEGLLASSATAFTLLHDDFYGHVMPDFVGADGVLRGLAGSGAVSLLAVDSDDAAARSRCCATRPRTVTRRTASPALRHCRSPTSCACSPRRPGAP